MLFKHVVYLNVCTLWCCISVCMYVVAIVQHTNSTVLQTHRVMGQEQVGAREMRERKRTEPIWISHTSMIPSPTTFDESDRTLRVVIFTISKACANPITKSADPLKSRGLKVAWVCIDTELPDILTFRRPCSYQKVPLLTCKLSFLISLSKSYKKY